MKNIAIRHTQRETNGKHLSNGCHGNTVYIRSANWLFYL